jgi:hypothetical protein
MLRLLRIQDVMLREWAFTKSDIETAVDYAKFYSRSKRGEVRVFDAAGQMIAVESWAGDSKKVKRGA